MLWGVSRRRGALWSAVVGREDFRKDRTDEKRTGEQLHQRIKTQHERRDGRAYIRRPRLDTAVTNELGL